MQETLHAKKIIKIHLLSCRFTCIYTYTKCSSTFLSKSSNIALITSIETYNSWLSNDAKTNIIVPFNFILYAILVINAFVFILAILSLDSFLILLQFHQIGNELHRFKATNLSFQTMQKAMILIHLIRNYI